MIKIKNDELTTTDTITEQMLEPRPLPLGRQEFDEWSERIICGTLLPETSEDPQILYDSQKQVLATMILQLGPTESHKPDAFFIHTLRKAASNQVAHTIATELREKAKMRLAIQEAKQKELEAERLKQDDEDYEEGE